MKIDVTVIIAAYNAAQTIATAIDSVLNQTHYNLELIVVDDCSADDTFSIAMAYAQHDSRVKVLKTPQNMGPSAARNTAIRAASGAFFTVLDADDWFTSDRLTTLLNAALNNNADVVIDSYFLANPKTKACYAAKHTNLCPLNAHQYIDGVFFIANGLGSTKPLISMALIRQSNAEFNEHINGGEDLLLYAQLVLSAPTSLFINCPTYCRTESPQSISRGNRIRFLNDVLNAYAILRQLVQSNNRVTPQLLNALIYREMVVEDALVAAKWKHWLSQQCKPPVPSTKSLLRLIRHIWCRKARYSINVLS